MKRIMRLVAAVAIVVGLFGAVAVVEVADAPPASAHNQDNYSYWYCSAHRSNVNMTVIHSKVYGLWPGQIGYYCREDFFGVSFQYWVIVQPPGSNFSYMPWGRQKCNPGGIVWCEEPGPW